MAARILYPEETSQSSGSAEAAAAERPADGGEGRKYVLAGRRVGRATILSPHTKEERVGAFLSDYSDEQIQAFNLPVAPREGPSGVVIEALRRQSIAIAAKQQTKKCPTPAEQPGVMLVEYDPANNSPNTTLLERLSAGGSRKTALVAVDGIADKIKRLDEAGRLRTTVEDQKKQQQEEAAKGKSEIMQSVNFLEPAKLLLEDAFLITEPFRFSILNKSISVKGDAVRDVCGFAQMTYYKNGAVSFDHVLSFKLHFTIAMVVTTASTTSRNKELIDQHKSIKGYIAVKDLEDLDDIDLDIVYPQELYTSDPKSDLSGFVGSQVRAAMRSNRCKTHVKKAIIAFETACIECLKEKVRKRNMNTRRRAAIDKGVSPTAPMQRRQSMAGGAGLGIGADRRQSMAGGALTGSGSGSSSSAAQAVDETTEMVGGVKLRRTSVAATALLLHELHEQGARPRSRDRASAISSGAGRMQEGEVTTQRIASVAFNSNGASVLIGGLLDESTMEALRAQHTIRQEAAASRPQMLPPSLMMSSSSDIISNVILQNKAAAAADADSSSIVSGDSSGSRRSLRTLPTLASSPLVQRSAGRQSPETSVGYSAGAGSKNSSKNNSFPAARKQDNEEEPSFSSSGSSND